MKYSHINPWLSEILTDCKQWHKRFFLSLVSSGSFVPKTITWKILLFPQGLRRQTRNTIRRKNHTYMQAYAHKYYFLSSTISAPCLSSRKGVLGYSLKCSYICASFTASALIKSRKHLHPCDLLDHISMITCDNGFHMALHRRHKVQNCRNVAGCVSLLLQCFRLCLSSFPFGVLSWSNRILWRISIISIYKDTLIVADRSWKGKRGERVIKPLLVGNNVLLWHSLDGKWKKEF